MKAIVEGLLFLSGEDGLTLEEISNIIEKDISEVKGIIKELYNDYSNTDRGIQYKDIECRLLLSMMMLLQALQGKNDPYSVMTKYLI